MALLKQRISRISVAMPLPCQIRPDRPAPFPPPWQVGEATESFCIRDANGQVLAFVYFEH